VDDIPPSINWWILKVNQGIRFFCGGLLSRSHFLFEDSGAAWVVETCSEPQPCEQKVEWLSEEHGLKMILDGNVPLAWAEYLRLEL